MSHENPTQKGELIESNSYTSVSSIFNLLMKPAVAKAPDSKALEDLGRAALQIVHDLKNQLNGIKLYATFLKKRLERDDCNLEEVEILSKLIAGLDRAARETNALLRYARPLEIHRRRANLRSIVVDAIGPAAACISNDDYFGEFDPESLLEAFRTLNEHALSHVPSRDQKEVEILVHRSEPENLPEVVIEWRGARFDSRVNAFALNQEHASVHAALAARIIAAHGGRVEFELTVIRAFLPLTD
jgi:signal transduction histidine kinase